MEANGWRSGRFLSGAEVLLCGALALMTSAVAAQTPGTFSRAAGEMTAGRSFHAAIPLRDGTVLVFGDNSADTYDPATRAFTATGPVIFPRKSPTGTLLNDGRVLIAGGHTKTGAPAPPELYDPATRAFTQTGDRAAESLSSTAILLRNGKVLILGGIPELFDPSTGMFTIAPGQSTRGASSYLSTVTLLADGRILIGAQPTSELYDPETGSFSVTGNMKSGCFGGSFIPLYISGRTATLLKTGKVLLTGGHHEDCGRFPGAELYDPATGIFTATGRMARSRDNHAATLLMDGTVLITGGESEDCSAAGCRFSGTESSAEIYNPTTGTFSQTGKMAARRAGHTASLLANGDVLITGGYSYEGPGRGSCCFADAELYAGPARAQRRRSVGR